MADVIWRDWCIWNKQFNQIYKEYFELTFSFKLNWKIYINKSNFNDFSFDESHKFIKQAVKIWA